MRRLLPALWLGILQAAASAQAFPASPAPASAPLGLPSSGATTQMGLYVVLLLALFAGGAWVLRYGLPGLPGGNRAERHLHIRETRGLGGRQFLVVAEYEGRKILLGVCPGRIEHLCELGSGAGESEFPKIGPEPEKIS